MNIIDGYKNKNSTLIIIISGYTNKCNIIGKWLSEDLKMKHINIDNEKYNKKDKYVILTGGYFPKDKYEATIHIHIKISKQEMSKELNEENINTIIYPKYLEELKTEKIDKWINGTEKKIDQIYIEITEYIFNYIQSKLK